MRPADRLAALTLLSAVTLASSALAIIIRDDVWRAGGGSEENWTAGFDQAIASAAEPQFASVLAIYRDDGSQACSGTWIGNGGESGNAFILTAAHCFNFQPALGERVYVTDAGTELVDVARTIHPSYDPDASDISGYYDLAVVELSGPIEDSGEAPALYAGTSEHGSAATQVGYGMRGTGDHGATDDFKAEDDTGKAAARNTIDPFRDFNENENGDTFLSITLDMPDNPEGKEVDELQGIGVPGDIGGSLWIESEEGWRIAGVYAASYGTEGTSGGEAVYNDATAFFARVSGQIDFIRSVFGDVEVGR